jgi:hypothetical protein
MTAAKFGELREIVKLGKRIGENPRVILAAGMMIGPVMSALAKQQ